MDHVDEQIIILTKFRCEEVLEWTTTNDWFNTALIKSIYDKCEKGYTLTEKQVTAVKNIHEKFIN